MGKPIILMVDGDKLTLKTKTQLIKGNMSYYSLYFSGMEKRKMNIAQIESLTMKKYVLVGNNCVCGIPSCFDVCDEIKVSLVTVDGDIKHVTENCFLYFK